MFLSAASIGVAVKPMNEALGSESLTCLANPSIMSYWDVSEADEVTTDMCNITGDPSRDLTYVIPREKRLPGWFGNLKEELSFQMSHRAESR